MSKILRTEHWPDNHVDHFVIVLDEGESDVLVCEQVGRRYDYVRKVAEELERRHPDAKVFIITLDPTKTLDFLVKFEDDATELWPEETVKSNVS